MAHRGGGMGYGPLPFAGGLADQPALLMEAFNLMGHFAEMLEPAKSE